MCYQSLKNFPLINEFYSIIEKKINNNILLYKIDLFHVFSAFPLRRLCAIADFRSRETSQLLIHGAQQWMLATAA